MVVPARLITPKGEVIELSPAEYRKIRRLVLDRHARRATSKLIQSAYGKYVGKPSLIKILLAERAADLAREEAKIKRWHGRK